MCIRDRKGTAAGNGELGAAQAYGATVAIGFVPFPVTMRRIPTLTSSAAATLGVLNAAGGVVALNALPAMAGQSDASSAAINLAVAGGLVAGNAAMFYTNGAGYIDFSAYLA